MLAMFCGLCELVIFTQSASTVEDLEVESGPMKVLPTFAFACP